MPKRTPPTTPEHSTIPDLHPGQAAIRAEARRYNVIACGRRWGKTMLAQALMAETVRVGGTVGYFTPTYKLLLEVWEWMKSAFAPDIERANATERRMRMTAGGSVEMWTLEDENAGRSRRYHRVLIDEAGLCPELGKRFRESIRPTLADYRGDAWLLGTPRGQNFFWECFCRGMDPAWPEWAAWQRPTADNPHIAPEEVEEMRRDLPDRVFRQEIEAEFLDDGGGVFRGVREAAILAPEGPQRDRAYVIGVDWARSNDFTVFSILDVSAWPRRQVWLERFSGVAYHLQTARLKALHARYRPQLIIAERNNMGGPLIELLQLEDNLPIRGFDTTSGSKATLVDALTLALEREQLLLLNDAAQTAELQAYTAHHLPSGLLRYSAPEGKHDDTVIALMLAWSRANDWEGAYKAPETNKEVAPVAEVLNRIHWRKRNAGMESASDDEES